MHPNASRLHGSIVVVCGIAAAGVGLKKRMSHLAISDPALVLFGDRSALALGTHDNPLDRLGDEQTPNLACRRLYRDSDA